eukprot:2070009-Pyramimonas_sp.AAC.1
MGIFESQLRWERQWGASTRGVNFDGTVNGERQRRESTSMGASMGSVNAPIQSHRKRVRGSDLYL